ncbi:MAG TPA: FAD-dependent monooxygenase [Gammaproteobacteria bacterium]|mgnify:CR=1 FL=1|nr:FAD-dependent monooxygenase [Gammaproteobacteria bacterium]
MPSAPADDRRRPPRVAVVGGSMAGLFAAVLLERAGLDVTLFERSVGELASRGAGIATHDELYAAFTQAGISLNPAMGVVSLGRVTFDREGNTIGSLPMRQIMTSWSLMYRFLRAQCNDARYVGGASVVDVAQSARGVTLHFADGRRHEADWAIAADGLRSTLRSCLLPGLALDYGGYVAWRGLAAEADLPHDLRAALEARLAFCLPPGEQMLGYFVAGPHDSLVRGERWYNWVWYRPAPAEDVLPDLLTDAQGTMHAQGIPPPLLRESHVEAMREAAARLLCPQFRRVIEATPRPFIQPIWDLCAPRFVLGRVILIGDAACTARPHIGLGVSKAADDAARLAAAFAAPDRAAALAAWERERLGFARAAREQSRRLGSYLGPPRDPALAAHYGQPAQVMAQVAAAHPRQYLELLDV